MPKYEVTVDITGRRCITVGAKDEDDAIEKARYIFETLGIVDENNAPDNAENWDYGIADYWISHTIKD